MIRKVILFSPNGYVGSFIKKSLERDKDIQLYEITRKSNLEQYQMDYDILIYSAAVTSVRHEKADKYVQDNVVTAVSIIEFCLKHHVKRIIYLSTVEIYGELNTNIITEKTIMVNPNLYAVTKYLAEKIIMDSGIPYFILRLPSIVGQVWGQTFVYRLMDKMKNNEPVEIYNMERKFNNIVDVEDLIRFIVILCRDYCDINICEIFLLGNRKSVELKDIVLYIKSIYHSSSDVKNIEMDNKRCFTLDVSKAVEYGYYSKEMKVIIDGLYRIQGM